MSKSPLSVVIALLFIALLFAPILVTGIALSMRKPEPKEPHECNQYFYYGDTVHDKCRRLRETGVSMNTILIMYREDVR